MCSLASLSLAHSHSLSRSLSLLSIFDAISWICFFVFLKLYNKQANTEAAENVQSFFARKMVQEQQQQQQQQRPNL